MRHLLVALALAGLLLAPALLPPVSAETILITFGPPFLAIVEGDDPDLTGAFCIDLDGPSTTWFLVDVLGVIESTGFLSMNTDELQDNPDKNKAKFQDSTESDAQEEILAFAVDANSGLATVGPADRTTMKGKAEYVIGIGPAEDSFGRVRVKDKAAGTKVTVEGAAFKLVEDSECIIELTTDSFRPVKVRIKGTTDRGRRVNLSIPR